MINVRVDPQTPEIIKRTAYDCGYVYGGEGATGEFLDAIALVLMTEEGAAILKAILKKDSKLLDGATDSKPE